MSLGASLAHFAPDGQNNASFKTAPSLQEITHLWAQPDGSLDDTFANYDTSFGGLTTGLVDVQNTSGKIDSLTAGAVNILERVNTN